MKASASPEHIRDAVLGNNAPAGINANPTLNPVVSDLDNPADRRLRRLQRVQPSGSATASTKASVWSASGSPRRAICCLKLALYHRQAVVVPLLGFGIRGGARVARGGIDGVTGGLVSALKRAWRHARACTDFQSLVTKACF